MCPGLLSYCCMFSHCPGSKEIAMHHFFWYALYFTKDFFSKSVHYESVFSESVFSKSVQSVPKKMVHSNFFREGCKKKRPVFIGFYYEGGGGSAEK